MVCSLMNNDLPTCREFQPAANDAFQSESNGTFCDASQCIQFTVQPEISASSPMVSKILDSPEPPDQRAEKTAGG